MLRALCSLLVALASGARTRGNSSFLPGLAIVPPKAQGKQATGPQRMKLAVAKKRLIGHWAAGQALPDQERPSTGRQRLPRMAFEELWDASCTAKGELEVEVRFDGRSRRLRQAEADESAFADVDWWRGGLEKQELSEEDEAHIERYTGSWAYARNVGRLLRGVSPKLQSEDPGSGFQQQDRGRLTKEVLDFAVGMAVALNKLPAPEQAVELYRGSWVSGRSVVELLSKPKGLRLPWFQSTTSDERHSYRFLLDRHARNDVDVGEILPGRSYPVHFAFSTRRAKDVGRWNPEEREHIVLPNTAFDVVGVERVVNDPLAYMSIEELSNWLESRHALPAAEGEAGPWPEAAAAVRQKAISGRDFARAYRESKLLSVCRLMGIDRQQQAGLRQVLEGRFELGNRLHAQAHFPFYLEVRLQDAQL